jgi:glutamate decarboxylase
LKEVKLTEGYYVMDPLKAVEMVDENTICVAAILGSTLTGEYEDVKLLNDLLVEKNKETGYAFLSVDNYILLGSSIIFN